MESKVSQIITEQIIKGLEAGKIPWHKPWLAAQAQNFISKHKYTGINPLLLALDCDTRGHRYPLYASYKQIQEAGYQVNKGAKSAIVCFTKKFTSSKQVENDDGDIIKEAKQYYLLRYYRVFNISEINVPLDKYVTQNSIEANVTADELLNCKAPVIEYGGGRAS